MRKAYIIADNICSPLGKTSAENLHQLTAGISGIRHHDDNISPTPFFASLFSDTGFPAGPDTLTRFERLALASLQDALQQTSIDPGAARTAFILSSTKGNIGLLNAGGQSGTSESQLSLSETATRIAKEAGIATAPLVVSHACISGLLAIITGMRLIQSDIYDTVAVTGADLISEFILSGFQSFQAVSKSPCKPFDAMRDGISLGEAAGTVVLSATPSGNSDNIEVSGGAVSNDANHISGPSRTGEELYLAIGKALKQAGRTAKDIDFISAHGTATRYNDEMEAKAVTLAGMSDIPLNSLKGYYGHTLGAAGVIESVVSLHSLRNGLLYPTLGFETPGTEKKIRVMGEPLAGSFSRCLKTASGFGGCNAAIVIEKTNKH